MFVLISGTALASEPVAIQAANKTVTDGKEYYREIYDEYTNKPLEVILKVDLSASIGSVLTDVKVEGFYPKSKVIKMTAHSLILSGNLKYAEFNSIAYMEQVGKKVVGYYSWHDDWHKKTKPNSQLIVEPSSAEDNLKIIKAVNIIKDTPEAAELRIIFDFDEIGKQMQEFIQKDNGFKSQAERDNFMNSFKAFVPYLEKVIIKEYLDKLDKTLRTEIDLTPVLKDAVIAYMDTDKDITAKDRKEIMEILDTCKATISMQAKILLEPNVIKVPREVKRVAEEVKAIKHTKVKPKAPTVE